MANKYVVSAPLPHTENFAVQHTSIEHPILDIGYVRGKGFLPPCGKDQDGEPLIPEIPANAPWHRCLANQAGIEWIVEGGGKGLSFIDFSGNIVFDCKPTSGYPNDVIYLKVDDMPKELISKGWMQLTTNWQSLAVTYSREVLLGRSCVLWKGGVSRVPDSMITDKRLAGWCWWDGDLVVWSPHEIYNVSTEETIYRHVSEKAMGLSTSGHPLLTYIGRFLGGYAIICVCREFSGDRSIEVLHRVKITKKPKKPKKIVLENCPICFAAKPRRVAYNCGHALCCVECGMYLANCPICRAEITTRIQLY